MQTVLHHWSLGVRLTTIETSAFNTAFIYDAEIELKLPNSLLSIGNFAFNNNNLSGDLIIPNSVKSIGDGAFEGNPLNSVSLPSGCDYDSSSFDEGVKITVRP